jgi:hypothetical protein
MKEQRSVESVADEIIKLVVDQERSQCEHFVHLIPVTEETRVKIILLIRQYADQRKMT